MAKKASGAKKTTKKTAKKTAKKRAKKTAKGFGKPKCFKIGETKSWSGGTEECVVFAQYEHAFPLMRLIHLPSVRGEWQLNASTLLPLLRRLERMTGLTDESEASRKELIAFIEDRLKGRLEAFEKAKAEGLVNFNDLWLLFTEGQTVAIPDNGVMVAGVVDIAEIRSSFFGPFFQLTIQAVQHDGSGFERVHVNMRIPAFNGPVPIKSLQAQTLSEEEMEKYQARGVRILQYCQKPSYLQYSGTLMLRTWRGPVYVRSSGRCMIDAESFGRNNPNYEGLDDTGEETMDEVPDELVYSMSPWVMGFSFTSKMWGEFNSEDLSEIEFNDDAWDKLVLPDRQLGGVHVQPKRMIKSLVERGATGFTDVISGKGGGLIFLLHGPAGVGKTLTAEAVADLLRRPLYTVGIGELGTNTATLEKNLRGIMDMAQMWNAVLLLDEADIFLERRTAQDIERNAMVGIFLRMLEYYQGVLFMTTNRVNEFDPAFNSRISIALRYPHLDADVRTQVWENLLGASGIDSSTLDISALAQHDINGRQIKNAIRIGLALAAEEGRPITQDDILQTIHLGAAFNQDLLAARDDLALQHDEPKVSSKAASWMAKDAQARVTNLGEHPQDGVIVSGHKTV